MSVGTTLTSTHSIMRFVDSRLVITECNLDLVLGVTSNRDKKNQATMIERMRFWLDHVFDGCIVLPVTQEFSVDWLTKIENPVMFAPSEPNDFTLQVLLHAKSGALGTFSLEDAEDMHFVATQRLWTDAEWAWLQAHPLDGL